MNKYILQVKDFSLESTSGKSVKNLILQGVIIIIWGNEVL